MTTGAAAASISRVSEHDLDLRDDHSTTRPDEFVFEPNGWDIATDLGIRVDRETDGAALDELADAMLVWADESVLDRLTDSALDRIWSDELEAAIRTGLVGLGERDEWRAAVSSARVELDHDPRRAEVSREVIRHLAMQLGQVGTPFFFCLDCIDDAIENAPPDGRRAIAVGAAIVAVRNTDGLEGTPAQRVAVRVQLGRLGELGRDSLRSLAAEVRLIAAEPLPERPEDDDVWGVVHAQLVAELVRPELN